MSYQTELIDRIKDSNAWPSFERPKYLNELNNLANNAIEKNTIEGYLAALLIYHQLCEEMVKVLLDDTHFFIQLSVFPNEILFPRKGKTMFGQILDELKSTVSFDGKDEFIEKCHQINRLRIEIVHKLMQQVTLKSTKARLEKAQTLFEKIFELFDTAHDSWRVTFGDFQKDIDWDDFLD